MCTNLLKLNDNKTEFILIGTRNMFTICGKMQIIIGDDTIDNVDSAKNLRIHSDKHLKIRSTLINYQVHCSTLPET